MAAHDAYIEANSPPSSYAIADVLDGVPGSWLRVGGMTAMRAVMIWPGLYAAGIRGRKSAVGATLASASITVLLLGYYALKRPGVAGS